MARPKSTTIGKRKPNVEKNPKPSRPRHRSIKSILPSSTLTSAFNRLKPTWREYINYVQMAAKEGHEDMKRYYEQYLLLPPREQRHTTPERLCEICNIPEEDLVAEVQRQLWKKSNHDVGIIMAENHPRMVDKTVKSGLGNSKSAQFDRTNFLKATGFIPQPKPSIFAHEVNLPMIGAGNGEADRPRLPSHEEEMKLIEEADAADVLNAEEVS